jgi:hypothetical protein
MSDTFWCRGCQQHKKLSVRHASQKIGGALCCNLCSEKMAQRNKPVHAVTRDGLAFSIKAEHIRTSRIKTANRRTAETVKHLLAHCPAQ